MSEKRVFIAKSYNPYLNLAVEDWILNNLETNVPVLYLWQNNKTVVIGRHQNVYSEVDVKQAKADGVNIARRQSGGGLFFTI
jgi:lipoate-protein ligase A